VEKRVEGLLLMTLAHDWRYYLTRNRWPTDKLFEVRPFNCFSWATVKLYRRLMA
jgi:hypothetical protein